MKNKEKVALLVKEIIISEYPTIKDLDVVFVNDTITILYKDDGEDKLIDNLMTNISSYILFADVIPIKNIRNLK